MVDRAGEDRPAEPRPAGETAPAGVEVGADMGAARSLRWLGRAVAIAVAVSFVALLGYGLATKSSNTRIDDALGDGRAVAAPGFDLDVLQRGDAPGHSRLSAALADGKLN